MRNTYDFPPAVDAAPAPPRLTPGAARDRILDAAYELFLQRGIRDVGIAELISRAGIAKATFYAHFTSKDELVLAYFDRCHQDMTVEAIIAETGRRTENPKGRLLAIFDVLDGWFREDDFQACAFISTMLEVGPDHPVHACSGRRAGLEQPDVFPVPATS